MLYWFYSILPAAEENNKNGQSRGKEEAEEILSQSQSNNKKEALRIVLHQKEHKLVNASIANAQKEQLLAYGSFR